MRYTLALAALLAIWVPCAQAAPTDASRAAHDVMFPIRVPERDVFEGFETTVPPPGWSAVVNNTHTWEQAFHSPYEGTYFASCEYDDTYSGSQDEWLCVDHTIEAGDDCLCSVSYTHLTLPTN